MSLALEDLEGLREGWSIEAKKAHGRDGKGHLPDSFWDTYSAMANGNVGYIALGVRELSDGRLQFDGMTDPDAVERDLFSALGSKDKVSANVITESGVHRISRGGKAAIVIHVPRADRRQRPVYLGPNPFAQRKGKGTYVRMHEGDHHLPVDQVRRMIADADGDSDSQVQAHLGLHDLDPESVRRYRNLFRSHRPDHPYLLEDESGFLRRVGAMGVDRERGTTGPTLAGLLMLGQEQAIKERLPYFHLSYVQEDESDARWIDRVHPDGMWNANLFEVYMRVIRKLHAHVKVPFALDPDLFRRDETPVHEALREALVNALVHADYKGHTGVRIVQRSTGFEMNNPGTLLVPAEQVWLGGVSVPRNPTLQGLFRHLQLGERGGSGGPKIRAAWQAQHWMEPALSDDAQLGLTSLLLRNESLLPPEALAEIKRRMPNRFRELGEPGRIALVTLLVEGEATHSRLVEATGQHTREITLLLQKLKRWQAIESSGGRRGLYRLSQGANTPVQIAHIPAQIANAQSLDSWAQHPVILGVRSTGSAPRVRVIEAIQIACTEDSRTLLELSQALKRKPETLRVHYVRPMVRDGLLESRPASEGKRQTYRVTRTL
ncbi:MAG: ATP-dependent DNA helicase RecG [Bradymonadia bacterium]